MSKLKTYQFCDLYEMNSGISSKPEQAGHGSPFLSFSVVFNNYFLPEVLNDLMDSSEKEQESYSIKEGDIFLTRTSEVIDELGMSSVALKEYPQATYSGFLKRLRPKQTNVTYAKYMAFYLRSKLFRKTMTNNAVLTLRASLNEQIFSYLQLILPEYSEQVKFGNLLYSLNQKIEINNRINAELEAMAKTLYDYWFVQFDFPDENGKPYKSSGGKMVYSKALKREIPAGWEVFNLNKLVDLIKGNISPSEVDRNIPYVGLEHISRKSIVLSNWSTPEDISSEKTKFKKNDILFGKIRPYFHKVAAALFDGITSTDTIVLRAKQINYYGLALETVFSEKFIEAATQGATGSKMPRADWNVLQSYKVAIPNNDLLDAYQKIFNIALRKIELSVMENQRLAELRDWLLPMLMNGQVRVGIVQF